MAIIERIDSARHDLYAGGMTLQDVLRKYGIHRPIDFAREAHMSRQDAHAYWSGKRKPGRKKANHIHHHIPRIPYLEILAVCAPDEATEA